VLQLALAKVSISHDTRVFTFATPDATKSLGLATCACILARGGKDAEGNAVVRPYTPMSTNEMVVHARTPPRACACAQAPTHRSASSS
jgi:hypothetical protein